MKTKQFLLSMAILAALVLPSSCSDETIESDNSTIAEDEASAYLKSLSLADSCLFTGTIAGSPVSGCVVSGTVTDAEAAGLLFMREEEKMARDVYAYLYEKYKLPVFKNITGSESIHMSAVLRLITAFSIPDNSTNDAGTFANEHINELYNQLIEKGNLSLIDALKVGVLIEQTDIADLQNELSSIENASVKTVYTNLLAGSTAHLKAFTWNLKVRGITL